MSLGESISLARKYIKHRRLKNTIGSWLDYKISIHTAKALIRHYPPALMLEPTNICNLRCPLCPSGNGTLKRARGYMSLKAFQEIVDQIYKDIGMLILWNQGEPFLNKHFYEMIEYAAAKDMFTMTSTNASLPLDCARIVQSGLDKLIISMDGLSESTYNSYRVNGNFELVQENLRELLHQKKLQKSSTPQVVWQFIIMKHNEHEIPKVKHLAKELGVDKLEFKTAQIYNPEDSKFLPSSEEHSRYKSANSTPELKTALLNRCRRLWTQPVINWDGEMSICCYDKDLSIPIGKIKEHSFSQLWLGSSMNRMRSAILKNRAAFEICQNCGEGIVQKLRL